MGAVLVHAKGGGQYAAADHRNARQGEEALDGAVLAVLAVEDGQHPVQRNGLRGLAGQGEQAADRPVLAERHGGQVGPVLMPMVLGDGLIGTGVEEPLPRPGDAHGQDGIFVGV